MAGGTFSRTYRDQSGLRKSRQALFSQQRFLERARHWSAQRIVTSVAMELE